METKGSRFKIQMQERVIYCIIMSVRMKNCYERENERKFSEAKKKKFQKVKKVFRFISLTPRFVCFFIFFYRFINRFLYTESYCVYVCLCTCCDNKTNEITHSVEQFNE